MPLTLLLILVIGGIAGIAVLTIALGLGQRAQLRDAAHLRAVWDADNPDMPSASAHLSATGHAGLIERADGGLGIVWAMGADFATRPLTGAQIRSRRGRNVISTGDFTAPRIRLNLSIDEARTWAGLIEGQSP